MFEDSLFSFDVIIMEHHDMFSYIDLIRGQLTELSTAFG